MIEFKLPEIGENIESGNVVKIFVAEGDSVKEDQDLLELETDKASLPVPSPCDGVIKEILVKEGEEINVGAILFKIDESKNAEVDRPIFPTVIVWLWLIFFVQPARLRSEPSNSGTQKRRVLA